MTLRDVKVGQNATVFAVGAEGALRQHLLDMGIIPGLEITVKKYAPMGDPIEVLVNGFTLSLRLDEAEKIEVTPVEEDAKERVEDHENFGYNLYLHEHNAHPGIGEEGKYHSKDHEHPLPKGTVITFALAGQQNCGKTTLFNVLTGSNQHVGNFPGVTVDRKDGSIIGHPDTNVTDLPGIYSLNTYTAEEIVSRNFLIKEHPHCVINVVDASNIERNLYLTIQLMELGIPVVLAINMMDELTGNGGSIRVNEMERELGIPVVPVSAAKGYGIRELVDHALHIAMYQEMPARQDFCDKEDFGGAVHSCLHSIMHLVESRALKAGIPLRFAASRIVDGDQDIIGALALSEDEKSVLEGIICTMEKERGLDRHAAMADMRYTFIRRLCKRTVMKPKLSKEYLRSVKIDRILTGRWTAIPIFILVMTMVIYLTIDVLGAPLQGLLDRGIQGLGALIGGLMESANVAPAVQSLVVDAIFGGVGSVVSFVPVIMILFFFLSLLEDSGYMARVAFVTDKLLRRIGLTGRSIVPMLIGLGCSVPAVMSSRTLPSARDRKKTIMLIPFMSCSAKIPVYAFFTSAFFPGHGGAILVGLYLLSIVVGIAVALLKNRLGRKEEPAPFVLELPNYRLPQLNNLWHLIWDKTKDFLQRAFTVIFLATIIIWVLQHFDFHFNMVGDNGEGSILAWVAGILAPVFQPLGLGDWRVVTSLISGFLAKESIVATLEVLGVNSILTTATAVPMLIFCLLYTPCIAAISAVRRELGGKWAVIMAVSQCAVAWVCAYAGFLIAGLFM